MMMILLRMMSRAASPPIAEIAETEEESETHVRDSEDDTELHLQTVHEGQMIPRVIPIRIHTPRIHSASPDSNRRLSEATNNGKNNNNKKKQNEKEDDGKKKEEKKKMFQPSRSKRSCRDDISKEQTEVIPGRGQRTEEEIGTHFPIIVAVLENPGGTEE